MKTALRSISQRASFALRNNTAASSSVMKTRGFAAAASSASVKLKQGLQSELELEMKNYEKPEVLKNVPKDWKFEDVAGDVNLKLTKNYNNRTFTISWQLQAPFVDPDEMEGQGEDGEEPVPDQDFTEFRVSIETPNGAGMRLFCDTQSGESPRFFIRNIQCYQSGAEKENQFAYAGPDYEDLEDKLQENIDAYLSEVVGVDDGICEFIETLAVDKEHREYMRWLETAKGILA